MKSIEKDILALGMLIMSGVKVDIDKEEVMKLYESYFNKENMEEKLKEYSNDLVRKVNKKIKGSK